jgi:hypothetical protein
MCLSSVTPNSPVRVQCSGQPSKPPVTKTSYTPQPAAGREPTSTELLRVALPNRQAGFIVTLRRRQTVDRILRGMVTPTVDDQAGTWELINNELTSRLARQDQSSSRIETKATVVVGFAATAAQFLATQHASNGVLVCLAFVAYALSFGCCLGAIVISRYRELDPRGLLDVYAWRPRVEVIGRLAAIRVQAYEHNAAKLRRKAIFWWLGLVSLTAGLTLSAIAIVQTGSHDELRVDRSAATTATTATTVD